MLKYLFFIFPLFVVSQKITFFDSKSNLPIHYVLIEVYESNNISYHYSDLEGSFTFPKDTIIDINKVRFSCLGYESKELLLDEIKNKIYLTPKITLLNEVVVSNATKSLGNHSNNVRLTYGTGTHFEMSFFINNTLEKEASIKNFQFYISKLSNKLTYVMRFKLYKKDFNSIYPGELIDIKNNFFEINKKKTGLFTINITDYSMVLTKEGAVISVEIVEIKNKKGEIIAIEEQPNIKYNDRLFLYFTYGKDDPLYEKKYSFYKKVLSTGDKWFECVAGLKRGMPDVEFSNFKFMVEVFE